MAQENLVRPCTISNIVTSARKNENFIAELRSKRDSKMSQEAKIREVVDDMISRDTFIDKKAAVVKALKEEHGLEVKEHEVAKVMKEELRMSFSKVLPIPCGGNTVKSLIWRQQFALSFLKHDLRKTIFLNVDEVSLWFFIR